MGYKDDMFDLLTKDTVKGSPPRTTHSSGPVRSVDLMAKKNATAHHTSMYHQVHPPFNIPIYRRGEPFQFVIEFKEHFKLNDKNLRVDLQTGANPLPGPGTLVQLQIGAAGSGPAEEGKNWSCKVIEEKESSIVVEVKPTCACPIGVWKMTIVTTKPSKQAYHVPQHCYIIFNPWCKDDAVYIENEAWKNEYVLNQSGMAFCDNSTKVGWFDWNFGQFNPVTLPSALLSLELLSTKISSFSDPIILLRALAKAIGSKVLDGCWQRSFPNGTSPMDWKSSVDILKKFIKTKKCVRYAQCWVFATVSCSFFRALGIPCRVVTCYSSGLDNDSNLFIYTNYDMNGKEIEGNKKHKDSIWNFHVWDEVWMTRPDLPHGYGGWQAIDSTSGETVDEEGNEMDKLEDDGCGPMSVTAIKNGEIGLQYDGLGMFSGVNADQKRFIHDENGKFKNHQIVKDEVGKLIVCKAIGRDAYEDITLQYKFQETSADERTAFHRAAKLVGKDVKDVVVPTAKKDDVFADLMPVESVMIGKTFIMSVAVENRSDENRTIHVSLGANSVQYTGVLHKHLNIGAKGAELYKSTLELAPEQKEIVTARIEPEKYLNNLSPTCHINIFASVLVDETKQVWVENDNVTVLQPKLTVEVPSKLDVGTPFTLKMKFTNPLARELKKCSFKVDASCFEEGVNVDFRNVLPTEEVSHEMELTPEYNGPCKIAATFHSDLVSRVAGAKETHVNG